MDVLEFSDLIHIAHLLHMQIIPNMLWAEQSIASLLHIY